jgi:tetratricopeptide (TPR) repeat protein
MTADDSLNAPPRRPIVLSPWLVIAGALVFYGLTLNHWVSLRSLQLMGQVTGWDWHPYPLKWRQEVVSPLFLLVTAPVRLLPVAWQPLALNVFTALCAALTLGLLARSVRLLPHDRTREQRQRELGDHAMLCMRAAFLPALFAVLVLATHLIFWQNAIAATGEMLNLLVFAFVINCLLEYRVSQKDPWLFVSAFVYGLGTANNWALLGFFPLYMVAVFWNKGLFGFFKIRFLLRMLLCGLAGLLLYLLVPVMGAASSGEGGFAYLLHQQFGAQLYGLRLVPRYMWMLAVLPTLLPLIFASVRWPSFEGELSPTGFRLTRFMFSFLHVAFLALVLATFFDFKYSPSVRMREQPVSFLTFYYAGALCVGYFSGYMLLVFGAARLQAWERRPSLQRFVYRCLYGLTWVIAFGAPALLFWQGFPHIRAGNSNVLRQFADHTLDSLPTKKSIILSDDATRLYLLQADYERRGLRNDNILIDTEAFPHREYILYMASHHPDLKSVMTTNLARLPEVLGSDSMVTFVYLVTKNYPVYYLHPSFGYYFELLYLKPHGLVYELTTHTNRMAAPPLPGEAEIKTVQAFWDKLKNGPLKPLPELAALDPDAAAVSGDYGVALDYWGTELQKANHLKEAHDQFAEAIRLNTNNFIASINLQFNERLQKGDHRPVDSAEAFTKGLFLYKGLATLLRRNGPVDEPGLDLQVGEELARGGNLGQAAVLFQRRLQFLPGDPEAELAMAKTYADLRQPAKALELIRELRTSPKISAWELARCEALAYVANADYAKAEKVLHEAVRADPNDENRVAILSEYYRLRGMQFLREKKSSEAASAFTNALTNIDLQLQLLKSDRRDAVPMFDMPETLLQKAQLELSLNSQAAAVDTLSQLLQLQPKNQTALLNRALSEIQIKQFKAAKADFKELGKLMPDEPYVAEFGLAAVANAEKDKAEEMDHLKRCIRTAPDSSSEYQRATNRLDKLEHH